MEKVLVGLDSERKRDTQIPSKTRNSSSVATLNVLVTLLLFFIDILILSYGHFNLLCGYTEFICLIVAWLPKSLLI